MKTEAEIRERIANVQESVAINRAHGVGHPATALEIAAYQEGVLDALKWAAGVS